jgi:hypothetical protein
MGTVEVNMPTRTSKRKFKRQSYWPGEEIGPDIQTQGHWLVRESG